jgi:signal transduction histidine kinase
VTVLQDAGLVGFVALTIAAVLHLRRRRSRPASYLVVAFGIMAGVLVSGRLALSSLDGIGPTVSKVTVVALAAFPWLLAAFAWSFERRQPRWLRAAGVAVVGLGLFGATMSPLPEPADRSLVEELYVLVFIGVWGALLVAAAVRLWTAGGRQRLVRARMRLMAAGMLSMTVALFVAVGGSGSDDVIVRGLAQLLVVASAALFVAGFAPPLPLRMWWRRRASEQFQQMQLALIAASTPAEVGQAVVPTLAELLGGAVVLVGPDRQVLASAQLEPERAAGLARRLASGGTLDDDTLSVPVDSSWLLIRSNPYTPVFGQDEQQLVRGFSLQVQMALERAELFTANLAAQREAERARDELETMLYGLSHDLRSPAVAIAGFASLLEEAEDEGFRHEMIERIQASTAYLNDLVDALLELSRIGRAQDEVAPVDLTTIARAVAQRSEVTHPAVTVAIDDPLPVVMLNPGRAEQLLDNLVGNAVKHGGREDLTVAISSRAPAADDGGIELVVADDGRGVREEDRERIFHLFSRGADAEGKGSGLGLGMVQRIAEINGGEVRLDPGTEGATFVVSFPSAVVVDPRRRDAGPGDDDRATGDRPATSV